MARLQSATRQGFLANYVKCKSHANRTHRKARSLLFRPLSLSYLFFFINHASHFESLNPYALLSFQTIQHFQLSIRLYCVISLFSCLNWKTHIQFSVDSVACDTIVRILDSISCEKAILLSELAAKLECFSLSKGKDGGLCDRELTCEGCEDRFCIQGSWVLQF